MLVLREDIFPAVEEEFNLSDFASGDDNGYEGVDCWRENAQNQFDGLLSPDRQSNETPVDWEDASVTSSAGHPNDRISRSGEATNA